MGLSEAERVCKDHPIHDQRLGVCPSCLRQKLSQLYAVASYRESMVVRPCYSSSSSSTRLSPVHRHQRNGSDLLGSMSFRISLGLGNGLKKSKSIAFVPTGNNKKSKKKGFWSKILHPNKEKKEVHFDVFNTSKLF